MVIPLRLIERIDPFGRTLAVPPPFKETVFPGGVWLADAELDVRVEVAACPVVAVCPVVEDVCVPPVVAACPVVDVCVPPVVAARPVAPVCVPPVVAVCPVVALWLGVELCVEVDPCDAPPEECAGALLAGALGLLSPFFWPSIQTGTASISSRIADFCSVVAYFGMRFITASWPFNLLSATAYPQLPTRQ